MTVSRGLPSKLTPNTHHEGEDDGELVIKEVGDVVEVAGLVELPEVAPLVAVRAHHPGADGVVVTNLLPAAAQSHLVLVGTQHNSPGVIEILVVHRDDAVEKDKDSKYSGKYQHLVVKTQPGKVQSDLRIGIECKIFKTSSHDKLYLRSIFLSAKEVASCRNWSI